MNLLSKVIFNVSAVLLIVSCGPGDQKTGNLPEDVSGEPGKESVTRNEASLTPVKGVFKNPTQKCQKGFGLCPVTVMPQDRQNVAVDTLAGAQGERLYNATFTMDTQDQNSMRIEFLEAIPYFEDQFTVGNTDNTFESLFGVSRVTVVPGVYPTSRSLGQYGGVSVKIQKQ